MNKPRGPLFRAIATRAVIAAIPVAMASAYASGIFASPPRMASYDYVPVAEIVDAPNSVGVAASPLYGATEAEINEQLDQLQAIGVQNIRVFVPWGLIEQVDNHYDWSLLDRVMAAAAARNMGVMAEVNATPGWAEVPDSPGFPLGSGTPRPEAFVDFMRAFTAHQTTVNGVTTSYADIVSAYEIWNEPNFIQFSNPINPEAYAALLAAVYPVIKELDPTATVVAGAVGATQNGPFTMDPVTFVQRMMAAGAGNFFDAFSFHPYSDEIPFSGTCPTCPANILTPRQQLDAIKALIGFSKSVWLSEYGVASTDAAGYEKQAAWLTDLLDYWQDYGQAGPVFIYTGQDQAGSTDPGANMGLWTDSGGKKFYTTADGRTYAVSDVIAEWIKNHPLPNPNPNPNPVNPITALIQAIAGQVQAVVNAIVNAIKNFLSGLGLGLPAVTTNTPEATTLAASVESPEAEGLSAKSAAAADGTEEATAAKGDGTETATEEDATEETVTEETEPVVTEPEIVEPEIIEPEIVEPEIIEPEITEPVVTEPEATEPETETTEPETTEPEATKPETTKPDATEAPGKTEPATGSGASGTPSGSTPSTGSGESEKSEGSESKSGKDRDENGSGRPARGKSGGASVAEVTGKGEPVTAGATAGAEGASTDGGTS